MLTYAVVVLTNPCLSWFEIISHIRVGYEVMIELFRDKGLEQAQLVPIQYSAVSHLTSACTYSIMFLENFM